MMPCATVGARYVDEDVVGLVPHRSRPAGPGSGPVFGDVGDPGSKLPDPPGARTDP